MSRTNKKPRPNFRRGLHCVWVRFLVLDSLRAQSCRPAAVAVVMMDVRVV